ncbi:MAG: EF-P lysine aminoacylase EpmA [Pirellulales bacterium]
MSQPHSPSAAASPNASGSTSSPSSGSLWRPTSSPATLQARSEILWQLRSFFRTRGYAEVQTPTLSRDTVVDRYIDPIVVSGQALQCPQADAPQYYLQTSPEFAMKRLVAAGMQAIYQICPAYRAGERGDHHNPEFTMLEWYRCGQSFAEAVAELCELVDQTAAAVPSQSLAQTTVITYETAFRSTVALDPLTCSTSDLRRLTEERGLQLGGQWQDDKDEWLNLIFAECVQPRLGFDSPVIVTHYPASQAALSQVAADDFRTAERYELFIRGVEIANGYHELLDANELDHRAHATLLLRRSDGKEDLPTASFLSAAMHHGLPACCGCALGVDRMVMILTSQPRIDDVWAFPIERA